MVKAARPWKRALPEPRARGSQRVQGRRQYWGVTSIQDDRQVAGLERPYRGRPDDFGLICTGERGGIMKHGCSGIYGSVVGK